MNDASNMIKKWYLEIQNKFEFVNCGKYVIMPNHFHCIINIVGADQRVCPNNEGEHIVGADQRVCPNNEGEHMVGADLRVCPDNEGEHMVGADLRVCPDNSGDVCYFQNDIHYNEGEHMGSPLHRIVQWFKTMTTNEYIRGVKNYHWKPFPGKLWQRNYYEHIIRNNYELFNVENYIENNPKNWEKDSEN